MSDSSLQLCVFPKRPTPVLRPSAALSANTVARMHGGPRRVRRRRLVRGFRRTSMPHGARQPEEPSNEAFAREVRAVALRFLSRFQDAETVNCREDLAQDVALVVLQQRHRIATKGKWSHYVRTVARRFRYHALKKHHRRVLLSLDADPNLGSDLGVLDARDRLEPVRVAGTVVDRPWLAERVNAALRAQPDFDRALVTEFYEGASLRELSRRHGLPAENAKMRIHRCRNRLRRDVTRRIECSQTQGSG